MHYNDETAPTAGTVETAKSNYQDARTDESNRTSAKAGNRRRRPLTFHTVIAEDQETVHTLCGKAFPKRHTVRAGDPSTDPRERIACPDCRMLRELDADLRAQEDRRRRAEAITERVLRHLEGGDA